MPAREGRRTDATKLTLSLPVVAAIVIAVATAFGAVLRAQLQIQSDVRDVLTRLDTEKRVSDLQSKLIETNMAQMKSTMEAMARTQELQRLQISAIEKTIAVINERK